MRLSLPAAAACLLLTVGGCANDPGSMTQSDVEATLKGVLDLEAVSVREQAEGGYTGTGQRADGVKYTITVTQKAADRSLWYTATSEQGELKAGGLTEVGPRWVRTLSRVRKTVAVLMILFVAAALGYAVVRRLVPRAKPGEPGGGSSNGGS